MKALHFFSRIAEEILKCVEEPDIVLVCCGGGALLAGVSSGLSFLDCKSLVYWVEPKNGNFIVLIVIILIKYHYELCYCQT